MVKSDVPGKGWERLTYGNSVYVGGSVSAKTIMVDVLAGDRPVSTSNCNNCSRETYEKLYLHSTYFQ